MDETKDQNEDEDENNISTLGDLIHEPCAPCTPMARIVTPQRASMPDLYQYERQNSLMCRKDYTSLIFKRTPSQVWAAIHHRTKEKYALKKSRRRFRGHKDRFKYLREIQNVAQLGHHPNLVHYERAWQDDGHFFLVMELCTGGTLQKLIQGLQGGTLEKLIQGLQGPMVLEDTRNYAKGLLRGLARLHAQSLLHLDLKPDNLFLMPDGGVKIGDFGLCLPATEWDEEEGDREYLAPEILENVASPAADIFSAGLVMYQMLYGVKRLPGNGPEWTAIRSGAPLPPPPAPAGHASASRPAQAFADLVQSQSHDAERTRS
ncbi:kinase-like domain-containing protein [Baffinella frigidus]|nr:kinase-like domain-containing protein [Cryptophyta sp. CCMP2293]